jgi:hypothetical protein
LNLDTNKTDSNKNIAEYLYMVFKNKGIYTYNSKSNTTELKLKSQYKNSIQLLSTYTTNLLLFLTNDNAKELIIKHREKQFEKYSLQANSELYRRNPVQYIDPIDPNDNIETIFANFLTRAQTLYSDDKVFTDFKEEYNNVGAIDYINGSLPLLKTALKHYNNNPSDDIFKKFVDYVLENIVSYNNDLFNLETIKIALQVPASGGYKQKYLKYKLKYLALKKQLNFQSLS